MKFYVQLHADSEPRHTNKARGFYSYFYGPFDRVDEVLADIKRRWPNSKTDQFLIVDGEIFRVPPNPREKPESEKRAPGDESKWVKKGDVFHCLECDEVIQAADVAHPIHSRTFPGAGSGQVHMESVGYCPNCERKPNFHGTSIVGED